MVRIILLAAIVLLVAGAVMSWWQAVRPAQRRTRVGGAMIQDPVCSMYIPESTAIKLRINGVVHGFCSRACAEAFPRIGSQQPERHETLH